MRQGGAIALAQDEASSAVYGMPKVAAELGAAQKVLPLDKIAGEMISILARSASKQAS